MTSKTALDKLCATADLDNCDFDKIDKWSNIILKDLDKLQEYKHIEEEIGIDLLTFFKVISRNNIYDIEEDNYVYRNKLLTQYENNKPVFMICGYAKHYYLKDYGKTWALTKEDLDK